MTVLKVSTDNWQTIFGLGQAVIASVVAYLASIKDGELDLQSPIFWAGICYAMISGVKGYLAAGVKVDVKPTAEAGDKPVAVVVDKEATVKSLLIIVALGSLVGCSSLKGTMLDGTVCTIASEADNTVLTNQIINTYVTTNDQAKAQSYLTTARLGATALCEMLRARQAQLAQGDPATAVNMTVK